MHHMDTPANWKQEIKAMNGVGSNSSINLMGEIRRVVSKVCDATDVSDTKP